MRLRQFGFGVASIATRRVGPQWQSQRRTFGFFDDIRKGVEENPVFRRFSDETKKNVDDIKDKVESAAESVADKVEDANVKEKAEVYSKKAAETASSLRDKAADLGGKAGQKLKDLDAKAKSTHTDISSSPRVQKTADRFKSIGRTVGSKASSANEVIGQAVKSGTSRASETKQRLVGKATEAAKRRSTNLYAHVSSSEKLKSLTSHLKKETSQSSTSTLKRDRSLPPPAPRPRPSDAIVLYQQERTMWQTQVYKMWDRLQRTKTYTKVQRGRSKVKRTKGYKVVSNAGRTAKTKYTDAYAKYDDSQNPYVMLVRDSTDNVFSENEQGICVRAIRKIIPDFWPEDFMEELETDIVPPIVDAFLKGDLVFLNELCDEVAQKYCQAQMKARKNQGITPDDRILFINTPHLLRLEIEHKIPVVGVFIPVEQIDCDYDKDSKVVRGSPTKIANFGYVLEFTPDPTKEPLVGFPWRLLKMAINKTELLV